MAANNINAFCLDAEEKFIYCGTKSGQVLTVDVDTFEIKASVQAHNGSIETVTRHARFPYLAAFGKDRKISLWKIAAGGELEFLYHIALRPITPGDGIGFFKSTSQALAFHGSERRLAGQSGDCALFELEFDDHGYRVVSCHRPHGRVDFATVRYLPEGEGVLTGSVRGEAALSRGGKVEKTWDFGTGNNHQVLHWFEPTGEGNNFLIASDAQRIIRYDADGRRPDLQGEILAQDHVEHVDFNPVSGKAYCSSFDRNVYEVDPETCARRAIAWRAPFKLRWIKTLRRAPDTMIVQCRDGALLKIDLGSKAILARIKRTPHALWSAVSVGGELLAAGEGARLESYAPAEIDAHSRIQRFTKSESELPVDAFYYTKRLAARQSDGLVLMGRTDGEVLRRAAAGAERVCRLPAAVRDIALPEKGSAAFVAAEDGKVYRVELSTGAFEAVFATALPVWGVSYNDKRGLLAIGARVDGVYLLDAGSLKTEKIVTGNRFCKRLKWLDDDVLLIGNSETLIRYDRRDGSSKVLVKDLPNTIEDFAWDPSKEYLVIVDYSRDLFLADLSTGTIIDTHGDAVDYSKGVLFLDPSLNKTGYPGDFVIVGREGRPKLFRIHDDRIIGYGFIS